MQCGPSGANLTSVRPHAAVGSRLAAGHANSVRRERIVPDEQWKNEIAMGQNAHAGRNGEILNPARNRAGSDSRLGRALVSTDSPESTASAAHTKSKSATRTNVPSGHCGAAMENARRNVDRERRPERGNAQMGKIRKTAGEMARKHKSATSKPAPIGRDGEIFKNAPSHVAAGSSFDNGNVGMGTIVPAMLKSNGHAEINPVRRGKVGHLTRHVRKLVAPECGFEVAYVKTERREGIVPDGIPSRSHATISLARQNIQPGRNGQSARSRAGRDKRPGIASAQVHGQCTKKRRKSQKAAHHGNAPPSGKSGQTGRPVRSRAAAECDTGTGRVREAIVPADRWSMAGATFKSAMPDVRDRGTFSSSFTRRLTWVRALETSVSSLATLSNISTWSPRHRQFDSPCRFITTTTFRTLTCKCFPPWTSIAGHSNPFPKQGEVQTTLATRSSLPQNRLAWAATGVGGQTRRALLFS